MQGKLSVMDVRHELARHSAATLHEAAGRRGALPARIRAMWTPLRTVGRAVTAAVPNGSNLAIHQALTVARAGDVLVVAVEPGQEHGYWGDLLSTSAAAHGISGVVIDGGVRDLAELPSLGVPVHATGPALRGTLKEASDQAAVQEPIRLGDVTVRPGDWVVGDDDGVVVIAGEDVEEVLVRAAERERTERTARAALRAGQTTLEVFGLPSR